MIVHLFNSSVVSGPETLVLGNLTQFKSLPIHLVFLSEMRLNEKSKSVLQYAASLGFDYTEILVRSRLDFAAIDALSQKLHSLNSKIVHAHDVKASFYLQRATKALRVKGRQISFRTVSTHHGVRGRPNLVSKLYEKFYCNFVLPSFDRTLSVCDSDRDLLVKRGLPSNKVTTHLNGVTRRTVSSQLRSKVSDSIRKEWRTVCPAVSLDKFTLGIVGRYSEEKRHSLLLESLSRVRKLRPDLHWQLLCFGSGALEAQLRTQTQKLELENHVHWMGFRKAVGNEFAGFDLLVSISVAEGLPINLIEAGWAGTPVLATWVDGNQSLFPNSDYGYLVSPHDSPDKIANELIRVILESERRQQLGEAFQRRVKTHFSGEIWLKKLTEIYEELTV